ncbi:hypothetical protein BDE40_3574 [Litoreibacter halocynthiae]|uniref:Uncharacterized protein n=1 Tax=Litoreibacter halocynthiae TaxID=1242689 RepID=A0A4R7LDU9_9RHOB|nr:hypothetical protein [Litoreibacter halocynthiae]TDT72722.1 hypothetical protein BDE40_3574 [Litoreibacter halocynthiae]
MNRQGTIVRTVTGTLVVGAFLLSACTATISPNRSSKVRQVPDEVVNLAALGQDLSTARLLPEDGCYWYEHRGRVETTLLPLRSARGNPICVAKKT